MQLRGEKMKVLVIIPAYNEEGNIENTVKDIRIMMIQKQIIENSAFVGSYTPTRLANKLRICGKIANTNIISPDNIQSNVYFRFKLLFFSK